MTSPDNKMNNTENDLSIINRLDSETASNPVEQKTDVVTGFIVILDESGSMASMGKEPIQSCNTFIDEQKKNSGDDISATVVTFNTSSKVLINNVPIKDVSEIPQDNYSPNGGTALNDAVCSTIKTRLESEKPDNVVLVIITDGLENASQTYSAKDTRDIIGQVEKDHSWKVIFMGANIDAFAEGAAMNVAMNRCTQYDQRVPGQLNELCRMASCNINEYRRARTEGNANADVEAPTITPSYSMPDSNEMNRWAFTAPVQSPLQRAVNNSSFDEPFGTPGSSLPPLNIDVSFRKLKRQCNVLRSSISLDEVDV